MSYPSPAKKYKRELPTDTGYLQIGLLSVNEQLALNDRKYTLHDLLPPTADVVQKIFVAALRSIHPQVLHDQSWRNSMDMGHGLGPKVVYDASVDRIYEHLMACFPENSNMIDYGILLAPASDPDRTYQAISYIVEYAVFCESVEKGFVAVADELANENQLKMDLCDEIEDVQQKFSEITNARELANLEIPLLQANLEELNGAIKNVEDKNADLQHQMQKDKSIYEREEVKTKYLEQKIIQLDETKAKLQDQIIASPDVFLMRFAERKLALENAKARRTQLSTKIACVIDDNQKIYDAIDLANDCVAAFEDLINKMNQERNSAKDLTKSSQIVRALDKEIKGIEEAITELKVSVSKIEDAQQKKSSKEMITKTELRLEGLKRKKREIESEKSKVKEKIQVVQKNSDDYTSKIKEKKANTEIQKQSYLTDRDNRLRANEEAIVGVIKLFNDAVNGIGIRDQE